MFENLIKRRNKYLRIFISSVFIIVIFAIYIALFKWTLISAILFCFCSVALCAGANTGIELLSVYKDIKEYKEDWRSLQLGAIILDLKTFESSFYLTPESFRLGSYTIIRTKNHKEYDISFETLNEFKKARKIIIDYCNNEDNFRQKQAKNERLKEYLELMQDDINNAAIRAENEIKQAKDINDSIGRDGE